MITAWILLSPAVAEPSTGGAMQDVACVEPRLTAHRPVNGQEDVPLDAAMMLAYTTDGCFQDVWVTIEGASEVLFDEPIRLEFGEPMTVIEGLSFAPEETYTLFSVALGYTDNEENIEEFTFTTGDATAESLPTPPVLSVYDVTGSEQARELASWEAEFHVSASPIPSGLSYVEVIESRDPETVLASAFVPGTGELELAARWTAELTSEEICLQARQFDAAGTPTEWSDPDCMVPAIDDSTVDWSNVAESCTGCASGRRSSTHWVLLLPLMGLLRRRV